MRPGERARRLAGLALSVALGCTSDEWPLEVDEESSSGDGDQGETTAAPIDGAELEVFEPETPSIHYIGDRVPLSAEVRGADGLSIGFDDIVWTASDYEPTLLFAADGDVELPPGIYDITATARLPNGDRLESTVGGIRVQTRWTGIYSGDAFLTLVVDFQGTPIAPQCNGTIDLVVGFDGDTVMFAGGTCSLNAIIAQLDATYEITGEFHNGVGEGTIDYDVGGLLMLSFEWTGAFTEEGFLGGFSGTVPLPFIGTADAVGAFRAPLISPYVDAPP
ncbi:MAG TPA: hypothetical protein VFG69_14905 [Nannocystaceae bacterium]|nr:hypothetical protein [Nannocystaceae bacterium]